MNTLSLLVVLGTRRENSRSEPIAEYITKKAQEHPVFNAKLFNPKDMTIAKDAERDESYSKQLEEADALLLVVPEYNHGYPGTLKMLIDSESKSYLHKPVALAGVSSGPFGGVRAIESLLGVLREVGLVTTFTDIKASHAGDLFDENGAPKTDRLDNQIDDTLTELAWMGQALKWGRESLDSK